MRDRHLKFHDDRDNLHHAEQTRKAAEQAPPPAAGYRPETLDVLFARRRS
ncbi:MAG: hypothetical protein ACLP9Y_15265 [Mycobacterium sp.]